MRRVSKYPESTTAQSIEGQASPGRASCPSGAADIVVMFTSKGTRSANVADSVLGSAATASSRRRQKWPDSPWTGKPEESGPRT